ncbi:MAG: prephenate dehydrogenase/arogenate dehydrogenase family protein [Nitriliruptor sp.]|nr:MAG: prephenate dehydrogenase/arogenate dehydrogenase family protein [Nitriliruptor sp.]
MTARLPRVTVIGAGLVGSSIALAVREAGVGRVVLVDADPGVRARAVALGVAERVLGSVTDAVDDADIVIAAVPSGAVPEVLTAAAAAAPREAILTDAASLKLTSTLDVTSRLRAAGAGPERFVGGHPMAGSERSGPEAADAQLFQGATWVLTPTEVTADATLTELSAFLRRLGARVVALPPDKHDELVAVVSHLPQVVASTLAAVAADAIEATGDAVLAVAGGGFRDTTRIAASDPALWVPILSGNRAAVLEALDAYAGRLEEVRAAVADARWEELRTLLARASASRQRLVPKATPAAVADVVVPMDDRPGQLATATTALGAAGINVEDLTMRHAGEGGRGALLVRVAVGDLRRAVEVLTAAGLGAHVEHDAAGPGSQVSAP